MAARRTGQEQVRRAAVMQFCLCHIASFVLLELAEAVPPAWRKQVPSLSPLLTAAAMIVFLVSFYWVWRALDTYLRPARYWDR